MGASLYPTKLSGYQKPKHQKNKKNSQRPKPLEDELIMQAIGCGNSQIWAIDHEMFQTLNQSRENQERITAKGKKSCDESAAQPAQK